MSCCLVPLFGRPDPDPRTRDEVIEIDLQVYERERSPSPSLFNLERYDTLSPAVRRARCG